MWGYSTGETLVVIGSYTLLPFLGIFITVPLLLLRLVSVLSAALFKPDLTPIDLDSGLTSCDDFYGEPKHTVLGVLFTQGQVQREDVISRMTEVVGNKNFPELSKRLDTWFGQYYWGPCPAFNLETHVTAQPNVTNYAGLQKERSRLYTKPFLRNLPLWEIILLPNYKDDKGLSAFILRIHHVLGDGIAYTALLDAIQGLPYTLEANKLSSFEKWKAELKEWISPFAVNPFPLQHRSILSFLKDFNQNSWVRPRESWSKEIYAYEGQISLAEVKAAAVKTSCTVSEALILAVTKAVASQVTPTPKELSALSVLPKPGHPKRLTNHAYLTTLRLPTGETDSTIIIDSVRKDLTFKRNVAPLLNVSLKLAGILLQMLPPKQFKLPVFNGTSSLCTICFSNVALPPKPWVLFGKDVPRVDIMVSVSYHIPAMIVAIGYNGFLHISIRGRADVMTDANQPKVLTERIFYELRHMTQN